MGKFSWMALYLLQLSDWRYFIKSWMVICEASRIQTSRSVWQYQKKTGSIQHWKDLKNFIWILWLGFWKYMKLQMFFSIKLFWIFESKTGLRCFFSDDFPPQGGWAPGKDFRWDFFRATKSTMACQHTHEHVINPIVGVYIPIIRIPIKGGMTIPNIATFDHGTCRFLAFPPGDLDVLDTSSSVFTARSQLTLNGVPQVRCIGRPFCLSVWLPLRLAVLKSVSCSVCIT